MKNSYSCFYLKKLQRKTYLKNFINVLKKNNTPSKKQHSPSRLKKKNNVQNIQSFFYLHSAKHRRFQRTGFQIRKNFFSFDLPSVHRINLSVLSKKIKNFFHVSQSTCLPFKTWKNTVKNKNIFEISRININNFLNLQNAEFEKIFMTNIYPQQREVFSIAKVNQKNFLFLCPGGQKRNFFFCTHSTLVQKHSVEWVFFSTVTLKKKLFVFMSGGQKLFFFKKKKQRQKAAGQPTKDATAAFFFGKKKNKKK